MSKKCPICIKSVYPMDPQINLDGSLFHKECAKCADCKCQITLSNFTKGVEDGKTLLLCKTHYVKRFHTTGTFTGEEKFARQQNGRVAPAGVAAGSISPTPAPAPSTATSTAPAYASVKLNAPTPAPAPAPEVMTSTGPAYAGVKLKSASSRELRADSSAKSSGDGAVPSVSLRKVSISEKSEDSTASPSGPSVLLKKASDRVIPAPAPAPAPAQPPAKRWSFKEKTTPAATPAAAAPEPEVAQGTVFQVEENPADGKPAAVAGFMKRKGKMNKCFFVLRDGTLSQYEDEVKPEGSMQGTELMCAPIILRGCQITSPMPKKISIVTTSSEVELEANNAGNSDKWLAALEEHKKHITEQRRASISTTATSSDVPGLPTTPAASAEAAASRRASMALNPFQMEEGGTDGKPPAVCGYMNKDGSKGKFFFILRDGAVTQYESGDNFEGTNPMEEPINLKGATVASPEKRIILVESSIVTVRYEASNTMVCDKWIKAFQNHLSYISNFKAGSLSGNVGLVDDYLDSGSRRNSLKDSVSA